MMKKLFKIFTVFFYVIALSSCKGQYKPSMECIVLNNKAFAHLERYQGMYGGDKKELDTALTLISQAIKCDSNYFNAYVNMRVIYGHMANYNEAIAKDDKLWKLSAEPHFLFDKGMLFDKINKPDSAKHNFLLARKFYEKQLIKKPANAVIIYEIILLTAFIDGKERAMHEYEKQVKLHPELASNFFFTTNEIKDFNREEYVESHTGGPLPEYIKPDKKTQEEYENQIRISPRY
ncbi:MAG: hypothetical protein EOP47_02035 [Sphingobacteriaceae bacterium]|nr:MAG: hypothetical protein EOP47_02035 [Sphingobacteriaceae bacterium]